MIGEKISADEPRTQMIIAIELLGAINQATGGCEQMCFQRRDPRYLLMRDGLSVVKNLVLETLPKVIKHKGTADKKLIVV